MNRKTYVLLDRDGVVNQDSEEYIKSPEEWRPIPGSIEAIVKLNEHGFQVVIITNQSGIKRGLFDLETLQKIHGKMQRMVAAKGGRIAAVYYCPHGPEDKCDCRKPKSGMLQQFSREYNIELDNIYFVGDSLRDIQAGRLVGAKTLLVKTGKGSQTLLENPDLNVPVFEDLYAAANFIVSGK